MSGKESKRWRKTSGMGRKELEGVTAGAVVVIVAVARGARDWSAGWYYTLVM